MIYQNVRMNGRCSCAAGDTVDPRVIKKTHESDGLVGLMIVGGIAMSESDQGRVVRTCLS